MEKKYRLDKNDTVEFNGHTLYRIIALRNSRRRYTEGDMGGYIESEDNLSHEGECWISNDAYVFGSSKILDDAYVFGHGTIIEDTVIRDTSRVCGYGNNSVKGSILEGMCNISSDGLTIINSSLKDTDVYDDVKIIDSELWDSVITGDVVLRKASIESCELGGSLTVNNTFIERVEITGDAVINSERDFIVFKNNFSSGRTFVWTRSNDKWTVGCFHGTGKQLIKKAYLDSHIKGRYYEAYVNFIENIKKINDESLREFEQSTKDLSLGS